MATSNTFRIGKILRNRNIGDWCTGKLVGGKLEGGELDNWNIGKLVKEKKPINESTNISNKPIHQYTNQIINQYLQFFNGKLV